MHVFTGIVIALVAGGLFAFALLAFLAPTRAASFLRGFASSALTHYFELLVRLVFGASPIAHAPFMKWPAVFSGFGWLLIGTTAGLLLIPWRWHQSFSSRVIPVVIRFLPLYAVANVALGGLLVYGMLAG